MKFKRKLLSLGVIVAVTAPIAIAVSCGTSNEIKWDVNDDINSQTPNVKLSSENLSMSGIDGHGTFDFKLSTNQKILEKVKYAKKFEVRYFKDGLKKQWKDVTNNVPNDLSNYDEIKVTIEAINGDVSINGGKKFVYETGLIGSIGKGYTQDWYKPSTSSKVPSGVFAEQKTTIKNIEHKSLVVNLDKYTAGINVNELVFDIAKRLGYLFSETKTVKPFVPAPKVQDSATTMKLVDIYNALVTTKNNNIESLIFKYNNKQEKINLSTTMKNIVKAETYIRPVKDEELSDGSGFISAFTTPSGAEFAFQKYKNVADTPEKVKGLLSIIAGMGKLPEAQKDVALKFFPVLALQLGQPFQEMMNLTTIDEWSKKTLIRPKAIESIPKTFMSTMFKF